MDNKLFIVLKFHTVHQQEHTKRNSCTLGISLAEKLAPTLASQI